MPAPAFWCWQLVNRLPLVAACAAEMDTVLGSAEPARLCMLGAVEAAERISHDSSYGWLRLAPFLGIGGRLRGGAGTVSVPRPQVYGGGGVHARRSFVDTAVDLREAARASLALATETAVGAAAVGEVASMQRQVAIGWLRALVQYCPDTEALACDIFETPGGGGGDGGVASGVAAVHAEELRPAVVDWVASAVWGGTRGDTRGLDALVAILRAVPGQWLHVAAAKPAGRDGARRVASQRQRRYVTPTCECRLRRPSPRAPPRRARHVRRGV